MNPLQNKEFDILKAFVKICEELDLTYYLVCGSALGAVKYGGFIPWDDDVDVGLPREDYEVFCKEAQGFLPDGLFLQTYQTDPNCPMIYAKIRDSRTTYIEHNSAAIKMNHGVYIDVFPLDGYPADPQQGKILDIKKRVLKIMMISALEGNYSKKTRFLMKCLRFMGIHKKTQAIAGKYSKLISSFPANESIIWCNHGNWQKKLEYAPREQYGQGRMFKFEGLDVRVPEKYDEYLTQKYGDWRADLPDDQKIGHHYYEIMDLEKPYTEYI